MNDGNKISVGTIKIILWNNYFKDELIKLKVVLTLFVTEIDRKL